MAENKEKLSEKQKKAIAADNQLVCVTASAGTGKTTVLVNRFIHILEIDKPDVESTIALTFTKNAAAEMREKIKSAIEEKIKEKKKNPDPYWNKILRRIDFARISTFDSFYSDILRTYSFEAGLDSEFVLLDEKTLPNLLNEVFKSFITKSVQENDEDLRTLTSIFDLQQLRENYLFYLFENRKKLHLLYEFHGIDPEILPVPSEQEINDFLRNIPEVYLFDPRWKNFDFNTRLFIKDLEEISVSTIKEQYSIVKMQDRLKNVLSFSRKFRKKKYPDPYELKSEYENTFKTISWKTSPLIEELSRRFKDHISNYQAAAGGISKLIAADNSNENETQDILKRLLRLYRKFEEAVNSYKAEHSLVDFNDLSILMRKLLYENPNVYKKLRSSIKYILIDEFQDTDQIQLDILLVLAGINVQRKKGRLITDKLIKRQDSPSLFIVGDEKQSIYRFRGADVTVFHDVKKIFRALGGEIIDLDINFRSNGDIIEFHNNFFPQFMPSIETMNFEAVYKPAVSNFKRRDKNCVDFIFKKKEELQQQDIETKIQLNLDYRLTDNDESKMEGMRRWEAIQIILKIRELIGEQKILIRTKKGEREACYGDVALLFNAFTTFSIYEKELIAAGIPYRTSITTEFFYRPEIMDILNLLLTVYNPIDDYHLTAALRSPAFGINDETLLFLSTNTDKPLWYRIKNPGAEVLEQVQSQRLLRAADIIGYLFKRRDTIHLADFINLCIDFAEIRQVYAGTSGGKECLANIEYFIDSEIQSRIDAGYNTLAELLTEFKQIIDDKEYKVGRNLPAEDEDETEGQNAILVSTIHSSKGLEYPIVFIPNLTLAKRKSESIIINEYGISLKYSKYYPSEFQKKTIEPRSFLFLKEIENRQESAEDKRLMYVASTRAKDYIIFSGADIQDKNKRFMYMVSHFLPEGKFYKFNYKKINNIINMNAVFPQPARPSLEDFDLEIPSLPDSYIQSINISCEQVQSLTISLKSKVRFLPSELPDYAICPRLYYYRFVENIPEPEAEEVVPTLPMKGKDFGYFVHKMLEKYNGNDPPVSEFNNLDLEPDEQNIVMKETIDMISNFRRTSLYDSILKAKEVWREHRFIADCGGFFLEGAIDLIFKEQNGIYMVCDFKTDNVSEREFEKRAKVYYPQMIAYIFAASKMFETESIQCKLIFLKPGKIYTIKVPANGIVVYENELKKLVEKIREDKSWPPDSANCLCPYEKICYKD